MRIATLILMVSMALACSGGGGGGGSADGGIGGTGISRGVVTAVGSATVNGRVWNTDAAAAFFDGEPGNASALAVGMVVTIQGTIDGATTGVADRVEFDDAIEGPIDDVVDVDADVAELTILGQVAIIERGLTVFDGGIDFDSIDVGDIVEVSGFFAGDGTITATRVELRGTLAGTPTPEVELKGTVENLDDVGGSFDLGAVSVLYDPSGVTTDLSDLPGGMLMEGDFVEVEGVFTGADAVTADEIELEDDEPEGDFDEVEIEGLVSNFVSLGSFDVAGQPVNASGPGVSFEPSIPSFVKDGARVEVEGGLVGGVLVADEVKLREGEVRVSAAVVDAAVDVDPIAGTIVLLGITIQIDGGTRIEDDTAADIEPFTLGDIESDDFFEVRGVLINGVVRATELERDELDDVEVRGRVEDFDPIGRTLTILGVLIPTGPGTSFEEFPGSVVDEVSFYDFLDSNAGALLEAQDDQTGGDDGTSFDEADEVELEDDD